MGVAVGAESLSEGNERLSRPFVEEIMNASEDARDCMLPMGKSELDIVIRTLVHDCGLSH